MELETLQKAMQSLSEVQRERLHLYFFEGKPLREIAELQGISRNAVWESIQVMLIRMKKFFA
ncbi:RNA polymerase sigma factor [Clostridium porci]|uniref:RNA polymerase sigma factor n=1 Tax=Clostridium porci TaxID=2605778 RepID=UPI0038B276FE